MKVGDLYVSGVAAVTRDTNLSKVGALLSKYGLTALPVVDRADRVVGVVTDRDCLLELVRREALPAELAVGDVVTEAPALLDRNDDVLDGLTIMRRERVGTVPVVDADDRLVGVLTIEDVVIAASKARNGRELPLQEVIETLREIALETQQPDPRRRAAVPARRRERLPLSR